MYIRLNKIKEYLKINKFIGHRGAGTNNQNQNDNLYIENSMYAFNKAIQRNFNIVELDVHCTKDEEIIIYHDLEIENKLINSIDFCEFFELQKKIISKKNEHIKNFNKNYILRLENLLSSDVGLVLNLEIKYPENPSDHYIKREKLVKLILEQTKASNVQVFFSSFDLKIVRILADKKIPVFYLSDSDDVNGLLNIVCCQEVLGLIIPEELFLKNLDKMIKFRENSSSKLIGTYQFGNSLKEKIKSNADFLIID